MTHTDNPPRLFENDGAPAELRDWLRRAHDDAPSGFDPNQLLAEAERRVGPCAGRPRTGPSWRTRWGRHSTKLVIAAAAVGVGLGAGRLFVGQRSAEDAVHAKATSEVHAAPVTAMDPPPPAPTIIPDEPANRASATVRTTRASAKPLPRAQVRPLAPKTATTVATNTTGDAPTAADEYRLLRAAQRSLPGHPDRALELADEHKRLFASGMLAQEREAIAVDALVRLGKVDVATHRAHSLLAAHPESPYRSRIERSLAQSGSALQRP